MVLPAELLQAISTPGGGKVALVVGAGCSVEKPTGVPVSSECSREIYRRLVADGVLVDGDCEDPADLSLVSDAVFRKRDSQRDVVDRLREQYDLKLAPPNLGYSIAAAMLCEGILSSVVTLNFDLALSNALSELGAGRIVGVIERPEDLPYQKNINVYYLHRNVNAADPDLWILRTAALTDDWVGHWEGIIANKVLTAPVVVFAGLGTPVAVLIESTKLLKKALPTTTRLYQADPAKSEDSKFFRELGLDPSSYIQLGWGQLMEKLSERVSTDQTARLNDAVAKKVREDHTQDENLTDLLATLRSLGLVKLGKLRAHWLLHDKPYYPLDANALGLIADLLLALAMMTRISGALAIIVEDGIVEFHREGRIAAAYLIVSGRGHRSKSAVEADVESRLTQYRNRTSPPRGVLVGGTSDAWTTRPTPPRDIVQGEMEEPDVATGPRGLSLLHINELRENNDRIQEVVP
jgi:hypothetical protein